MVDPATTWRIRTDHSHLAYSPEHKVFSHVGLAFYGWTAYHDYMTQFAQAVEPSPTETLRVQSEFIARMYVGLNDQLNAAIEHNARQREEQGIGLRFSVTIFNTPNVGHVADMLFADAVASCIHAMIFNTTQIEILPETISKWTNCVILDLCRNQLTELPGAALGQLTQLREVWLSHNELTALPQEMSQLVNLRKLAFRINRVRVLPVACFLAWPELDTLHIGGNEMLVYPASLFIACPRIQQWSGCPECCDGPNLRHQKQWTWIMRETSNLIAHYT